MNVLRTHQVHMPGFNPSIANIMHNSVKAIEACKWFIHNKGYIPYEWFITNIYPKMNNH